MEQAAAAFGPIVILVSNAGGPPNVDPTATYVTGQLIAVDGSLIAGL